jgi:hypothetical protein
MFQNASAPPHPRTEFYFFNLWAPTHVLQFDNDVMSSKTEAFLKHASQCVQPRHARPAASNPFPPPSPHLRYPDPSIVSKLLQFIGANTPHYTNQRVYAEGFQLFS